MIESKHDSTVKVAAPNMPGRIVQRERLFQLLDESRDKPAIWITGPGGSGKTTLAASYLQARNIPCLWYQVDEKDHNPATFFYYMGNAHQANSTRKKKPLPLLTPEYLAGIKAFTRRYFEELFQNLPTPFTIVFDTYPPQIPLNPPFLKGEVPLFGKEGVGGDFHPPL